MKVSALSPREFAQRLADGELLIDIHPFVTRLRSRVPRLTRELALMYAEFPLLPPDSFADFHIEIRLEGLLRRWLRPQARFIYDGKPAFLPLPADHALTMVEWGLNWCVASHAHQFLVIHAAVLERGGMAIVLPAPPGSGKSTLCAALMLRGWRLLSDELALFDMASGLVHGMARPVNLKNASIGVIRAFEPAAVFSEEIPDTAKGTVALLRAPAEAVARRKEPARPRWVVLPAYQAGAATALLRMDRAESMMLMAEQSFNYDIHGRRGFDALTDLCAGADCYRFEYSRLDEGIAAIDALATEAGA
ncbi:HprK-related kinase A [Paucibacter sp. APW11]|uniref:HprK-related kinase A n=1 Tax=Roseateles aquae TaxID=3077235 RepID=A0ABU3PC41_9BURK|nr:HprK-related kinase A [Paucibacter sp. APW11]MDT9000137.1 HprK-related kinase A [Paucibacter sp. APW11]